MRVCSKRDVFVCKARFCPFQPEEACSDKGAEKGNKLTPEQVTQMFGPSTYWYCGLFLIKRSLDSRIRVLIKVTSFSANHKTKNISCLKAQIFHERDREK